MTMNSWLLLAEVPKDYGNKVALFPDWYFPQKLKCP